MSKLKVQNYFLYIHNVEGGREPSHHIYRYELGTGIMLNQITTTYKYTVYCFIIFTVSIAVGNTHVYFRGAFIFAVIH